MAEQPDYAALADRVGQWLNITPNNRADLLTALRQAAQEREALEHVAAVLPGPVWNEHRVLVWSALDAEKVRAALTPKGAPSDE